MLRFVRRRRVDRLLLAAVLAGGATAASTPSLVAAQATAARGGAPRPLTQADYDRWMTVQGTTLARDGRWVAFTIVPEVGDGPLVVRATHGAAEYRVPRGFVGRPQLAVNVDSGFTAPPPVFSADGRVVAALTYAPQAEFDRARREKRRVPPSPSLAVVALADGRIESIPHVRSFAMPRDAGG
ncbi:MAG TPA: hypothetical protein VGD56_11675, partial [Gemmatirosa sp.]